MILPCSYSPAWTYFRLTPVEQAILVDTFPPAKRAAAFALYSMAIVTAPATMDPFPETPLQTE
jgi:hypothetical protein